MNSISYASLALITSMLGASSALAQSTVDGIQPVVYKPSQSVLVHVGHITSDINVKQFTVFLSRNFLKDEKYFFDIPYSSTPPEGKPYIDGALPLTLATHSDHVASYVYGAKQTELFYRIHSSVGVSQVYSVILPRVDEGRPAWAGGVFAHSWVSTKIDNTVFKNADWFEYWFHIEATDGAQHWDSDMGRNHWREIAPEQGYLVKFNDNMTFTVEKNVVNENTSKTLRIAYDTDRVPASCKMTGFVAFDGKPPHQVFAISAAAELGSPKENVEGLIKIPAGAKRASIYFSADPNNYDCSVLYDSNNSKNWNIELK